MAPANHDHELAVGAGELLDLDAVVKAVTDGVGDNEVGQGGDVELALTDPEDPEPTHSEGLGVIRDFHQRTFREGLDSAEECAEGLDVGRLVTGLNDVLGHRRYSLVAHILTLWRGL